MRKLLIVILLLTFTVVGFSTNAAEIGSAGTSIGTAAFVPSKGVTVNVVSIASDYCATSQHASSIPDKGGMQYGALAGDSNIKSAAAESDGTPTPCTNASTLPF